MKKNNTGEISITLDMESGKMQRQLRAIAKHTEALANELRGIDEEVCPECGSTELETVTVYSDNRVEESLISCNKCQWNNRKA